MLQHSPVHRQLTSVPLCLHTQRLARPARTVVRSPFRCQSSQGSRRAASQQAQDFDSDSQQGARDKSTVQEKAQAATKEASKRLRATYQNVSEGVKKTAIRVNQRFDISGKAQHTADRVREQLEEVDDKLQLRRKAKNSADDVRRQWPKWRRQYSAFSKTVPGRVVTFALLIWALQSGLIFRLLNLISILFFLAPLVLLPLARKFSRQAAAAQAEQQAQYEQAQNPFASGRSPFAGFGQQASSQPKPTDRRKYTQQDGPIIDAEWTTIDEDD